MLLIVLFTYKITKFDNFYQTHSSPSILTVQIQ